jgi:hypothetical protein
VGKGDDRLWITQVSAPTSDILLADVGGILLKFALNCKDKLSLIATIADGELSSLAEPALSCLVNLPLALSAALTMASKLVRPHHTSSVEQKASLSTWDKVIWCEIMAAAVNRVATVDYGPSCKARRAQLPSGSSLHQGTFCTSAGGNGRFAHSIPITA